MKSRIIAAVFMIAAVVIILISGNITAFVAVTALSLFAVYEVCGAYGFNKKNTAMLTLYYMLTVFFVEASCVGMVERHFDHETAILLFYIYIVVGFVTMLLHHNRIKVRDMMSALALCVILVYFFTYLLNIKTELPLGDYKVWSVLVGACFTDTFALFCGKLFGKRKLLPEISPNKTVEGAIGGTVGAIVMMMVYGFIVTVIVPGISANYLNLAILGLISAIAAQIGDLSLSALKRETGLKDYGNIIPGHGGVLDRIDSVIFVAPAVYFFLKYIDILVQ